MIDLEGPEVWTFVDCTILESGSRPFEDWYQNKLSEEGKFALDDLLKTNRKTKNHLEWIGFRKFLKGKADAHGIWELGFKADRREHRVFGIFGSVRRQAILLGGCFHKMLIYSPPNAIRSACKVAREIKTGKVAFHDRQVENSL